MGYDDDMIDDNVEDKVEELPEALETISEKKESKKEMATKLQEYLATNDQRIGQIESQIEQIPNIISQSISQALTQVTQTQESPEQVMNQMPQEQKMMMFGELIKGLSQAYATVKGGNNPQGGQPDFQNMMAEWGMRMFNYHLDNMAQSVYQIKLPPPENIRMRNAQGPPNTQPQPPNTQPQHNGHRFA